MAAGEIQYKRVDALRAMLGTETDAYLQAYDNWIKSGKEIMECQVSKRQPNLSKVLSKACVRVLQRYLYSSPQATESMQRNVIVKCLFWLDDVLNDIVIGWDSFSNVKIIANNIEKEQQYLFFYLLILLGADVLLLQTKQDIQTKEELLRLSHSFVVGEFGTCEIAPFQKERLLEQIRNGQIKKEQDNKQESHQISRQEEQCNRNADGNIRVVIPERNRRPRHDNVSNNISGNRQEKSFEELANLASSVVMIEVCNEKGEKQGVGSGIVISEKGYILTNAHVACSGVRYAVHIEDDDKIYFTDELIKYHTVYDLAVIRIDRKMTPLPIYQGKENLVRGQKIAAIGSPMGFFNSVSDGIIAGFRKFPETEMIQYTAPVASGSSGGAVLNMFGEVIGITTLGIKDAQNLNLAVGYQSINTFIKGLC